MASALNIQHAAARGPGARSRGLRARVARKGPFDRVTKLLGTTDLAVETPVDVHDYLAQGMPRKSAFTLIGHLRHVKPNDKAIERALGMSERTLHRFKADSQDKLLDVNQASRVWTLADVLSKAQEVLGTQDAAERWLTSPALGLNAKRPIDLLETSQGAEIVKVFLERMEFGVYA